MEATLLIAIRYSALARVMAGVGSWPRLAYLPARGKREARQNITRQNCGRKLFGNEVAVTQLIRA